MLSMSNAEMLIHVFMTSRLDYCNALLGGASSYQIIVLHVRYDLKTLAIW